MKKGATISLFIFNIIILTIFIWVELIGIREDIKIDWKDLNPYLWMFSAIVSLLVLIIVLHKKFYPLTFNGLFFIAVIMFFFIKVLNCLHVS